MSSHNLQIKEIINHHRDKIPNLIAIYIYGSWGTKYERSDSDIDIAVLVDRPLNISKKVSIAQGLAEKLSRNVDLVDLKGTTTVMQAEIVSKGSKIYCANLTYCESFEDFVYSSYARLNEERSGILQDIRERGSIYG